MVRSMLAATIAPPVGFMPATQSARFGHRPTQEMLPQRSGLSRRRDNGSGKALRAV